MAADIAATGYYVFSEFDTALPRNGGDINYFQHACSKPKYLVAAVFSAQALLLGQAAGNAYTSGRNSSGKAATKSSTILLAESVSSSLSPCSLSVTPFASGVILPQMILQVCLEIPLYC